MYVYINHFLVFCTFFPRAKAYKNSEFQSHIRKLKMMKLTNGQGKYERRQNQWLRSWSCEQNRTRVQQPTILD